VAHFLVPQFTDLSQKKLQRVIGMRALPVIALVFASPFASGDPLQFDITGEVYQAFTAPLVPLGTFTVVTELDSSATLTLAGPPVPFTVQHFDISPIITIPPGGIPCPSNSLCESFFDRNTGFPVFSIVTFCQGCNFNNGSLGFGEAPNPGPGTITLSASGVTENAVVPEPGILSLMLLALAIGAIWYQRPLHG
jgi:hypothetical protein